MRAFDVRAGSGELGTRASAHQQRQHYHGQPRATDRARSLAAADACTAADPALPAWAPSRAPAWRPPCAPTSPARVELSQRNLLCASVDWEAGEAVVGSADHALYAVDLRHRKRARTLYGKAAGHTEWVTAVVHLPSGRVASGGMDARVCLWGPSSAACRELAPGHAGPVSQLAAAPGAAKPAFVSASYDKTVCVWDAASGMRLARLQGHAAPVLQLAVAPGSGQAAAASGDRGGALRWHDLQAGRTVGGCESAHDGGHCTAVAWHGGLVASGGQDGVVRLWDLRAQRLAAECVAHASAAGRGAVGSLLSAAPHLLVSAGADSTAQGLDVRRMEPLWRLRLPDFPYAASSGPVLPGVAFVGCSNGSLLGVDAGSGKVLATLSAGANAVRTVDVGPIGAALLLVCSTDDGDVVVWDLWLQQLAADGDSQLHDRTELYALLRGSSRSTDKAVYRPSLRCVPLPQTVEVVNRSRELIGRVFPPGGSPSSTTLRTGEVGSADKARATQYMYERALLHVLHESIDAVASAGGRGGGEDGGGGALSPHERQRAVDEVLGRADVQIGLINACLEVTNFVFLAGPEYAFPHVTLVLGRICHTLELWQSIDWLVAALAERQNNPMPEEVVAYLAAIQVRIEEELAFVDGSSLFPRLVTAGTLSAPSGAADSSETETEEAEGVRGRGAARSQRRGGGGRGAGRGRGAPAKSKGKGRASPRDSQDAALTARFLSNMARTAMVRAGQVAQSLEEAFPALGAAVPGLPKQVQSVFDIVMAGEEQQRRGMGCGRRDHLELLFGQHMSVVLACAIYFTLRMHGCEALGFSQLTEHMAATLAQHDGATFSRCALPPGPCEASWGMDRNEEEAYGDARTFYNRVFLASMGEYAATALFDDVQLDGPSFQPLPLAQLLAPSAAEEAAALAAAAARARAAEGGAAAAAGGDKAASLTYSVVNSANRRETINLLTDVSGYLRSSELVALMGPSGSGKTTLLDVLAGRKTVGKLEGELKFGGEKPTRRFLRRFTGYVEQQDTLLPILTVSEMLMYTAEMCRPLSESLDRKRAVVEEAIEVLALGTCRDVKIGSQLARGISGGQARRLAAREPCSSSTVLSQPTSAAARQGGQAENADRRGKALEFAQAYDKSELKEHADQEIEAQLKLASSLDATSRKSLAVKRGTTTPAWWALWTMLRYRTTKNYRDPAFLGPRIFDKLLFAFIMFSLYWKVGSDLGPGNVINIGGILFMTVCLPAYAAVAYVPAIVLERPLFVRERSDGFYHTATYLALKIVEELIIAFFVSLVFANLIFWLVQLQGSFALFWMVYFITLSIGITLGYTIAALSPNMDVANAALPAYTTVLLFFAGFLLRSEQMPAYWKWFSYIDYLKYGWGALMVNQFGGDKDAMYVNGQTILRYFSLDGASGWGWMGIEVGFFSFFMVAAYLALNFVNHVKR
eukprot:scaffold13.g295.t1